MTTADISKALPEKRRKQFDLFYASQGAITWEVAEGCSRCGAYVPLTSLRPTHELWHKNLACQLWLLGGWPVEHLESHIRETAAFQAVIASILGFMNAEEPSEPVTYEGAPPENPGRYCGGADDDTVSFILKADGDEVAHTHEDGTTHAH